ARMARTGTNVRIPALTCTTAALPRLTDDGSGQPRVRLASTMDFSRQPSVPKRAKVSCRKWAERQQVGQTIFHDPAGLCIRGTWVARAIGRRLALPPTRAVGTAHERNHSLGSTVRPGEPPGDLCDRLCLVEPSACPPMECSPCMASCRT